MDLIEKLFESRRQIVEIDGFKFKIERPTAMAMEEYRAGLPKAGVVVKAVDDGGNPLPLSDEERALVNERWRYGRSKFLAFVRDWPGMRELDIVPGGTGAAIPFDSDLFMAWVSDQPNIAEQLANAVLQSWLDHNSAIEATQKKSPTGSSPEPLPSLAMEK